MSYERVCNFCRAVAPTPAPDEGWLAFKVEGVWMDCCDACSFVKAGEL